jgi:transposase-like protein
MTKSSNVKQQGVKRFSVRQREKLLEILEPLELKNVITGGINDYVGSGTRLMLELLLHAEAEKLCGKWHEHDKEREFVRWGTEKGKALIDGAKRPIERPRVRAARNLNDKGGEVQLEMYRAMNSKELLDDALVATILAGVSARKYQSILVRGLQAKGVSKSTISRKAIATTKPMVEEFRQSRLDKLDLIVIMFDGIHVARKQMIACVGIDMNGKKHVLGLRVGATENDIVCRDLIRDMKERGLPTDKEYLFVIDGSKALANTIRAAFGQDVAIQRCQEHKIRDVQGYLPRKMRAETRKKLQAAYNQTSEKAAWKRLSKIRDELSIISENAVNSLTEGLYETLTVHRLGITGLLRKSLRTTNIMESAFSSVRRYMGRVTRFRDEAQIELWITRSILEAERHFRTLRGSRQLRKLRENLDEYRGGSYHA